ncbi:hypothetical protein A0H81_02263 [Grifola frondosa]|uniref:Uncharacterized protein n=1 Tax=Grifola frondosa TaxID=5627 RepID=A0A1C7MN58_GRIFR|nr:hypothetical protein A0H81_02263 [Grifola frondosa]
MSQKRKADGGMSGATSKKLRANSANASAMALVNAILANPNGYAISPDPNVVRKSLIDLAAYARFLEEASAISNNAPGPSGGAVPQPMKTKEELEEAAEKIRKAAHSGIKKQMTWKPSCKGGTAKWSYDGICPDPEVFGVLMGLGGPPKFKMKKFPKAEFESLIGDFRASARYSDLYITSNDITVRWSETGEFKFSGTYGK